MLTSYLCLILCATMRRAHSRAQWLLCAVLGWGYIYISPPLRRIVSRPFRAQFTRAIFGAQFKGVVA